MSSAPNENSPASDDIQASDTSENASTDAKNPQATGPDATSQSQSADALRESEERYVRLYADFENFKRRAAREREETRRAATESMISRLLPVLDNFEMALQASALPGTTVQSLLSGVAMIHSQLKGTFADVGVEEIDATGKPFDPSLHDAISEEESTEVAEGMVLRQSRKGFRLRERLIRPATVVVAKAPAPPTNQESSTPAESKSEPAS